MRKTGEEPFISANGTAEFKLLEFWQWNQSDLLNNALRGTIAEFIVGKALGAVKGVRLEWDAYDLVTADGIKVEVKSAAYVQSWAQTKHSAIQFSIRPAMSWEASTNTYATEMGRSADVYVFCLLKEQDRTLVNPLNLEQWEFYVLATGKINREKGSQKSIGLNGLLKMQPIVTDYEGINEAVLTCRRNELLSSKRNL